MSDNWTETRREIERDLPLLVTNLAKSYIQVCLARVDELETEKSQLAEYKDGWSARANLTDRRIAELERENARLKQSAIDAASEWKRDYLSSPVPRTAAELKHGPAGLVLYALQDGEISRGKAAEALAELMHGATEVRLPPAEGYFAEDDIPLEICKSQQATIRALAEALEDIPCRCTKPIRFGIWKAIGHCARCAALALPGVKEAMRK